MISCRKILSSLFRLFASVCLILLFSVLTSAQYHIENWTTEQGLPYKIVKSVTQTRDGYIWAATDDGLARFDGVRFTVFNTANTKNLPTNRLDLLVETSDGSLWMSGGNRGLIRYKAGFFKNYTTADGLPDEQITQLVFIESENLLRVATAKGAARFEGESFVAEDFVRLPVDEKNIPLLDNTGAVWIRQGDKIRRFTKEREEVFQIPNELSQLNFHHPFCDRAGNLWLAGAGAFHLLRFRDGKTDVFTTKDEIPGKFNKPGQPGGYTVSIFEDSKGNLWFGGRSGGLAIYSGGEFRLLTKEKNGLPGNGFHDFAEDGEGGIWAGTENGLARFSPQIINTFSTANGLTGDNIYPLLETRDGAILIGAWLSKAGLTKYENETFSEIPTSGSLFTALFEDRDGAIWVGSHNYFGVIENGKFKKIADTGKVYRAITEDRAGAIWLGTEDGELRRVSDGETRIFTKADGLPGGIYNLHFDRHGTLWIGTSNGLAKYENGAFTIFTEADGLSGNHVRSITQDADGTLWFGSFDNGITRLKDGRFAAIRAANGLHDNGAFQILEDDFGRFWISSNRGVYRVSRQELNHFADGKIQSVTSVAYGVKDGMLDAECNGGVSPAGFKSKRDGTLWFPTQKGVAIINPRLLPVNDQSPKVVIENCLRDRADVPCGDIEITPEHNSLEINYAGLSFDKPEQIRFKYKLDGLDADWVETGTRRTAFFTHLPPGEYVFRVSAANADGVWNETGANLKIRVKPPFYRTFRFIGLSVLLFGGLLFFAFNRRIKNLEAKRAAQEEFSRKLLESQERERQRIAAELHDSLGQDLLVIKNWAHIGLKNPSDQKTEKQFSEISETVSAAIDEVREIAYNLRPYQLDRLGLTKAVEAMLERVFDSSGINFTAQIDGLENFFPREAEINFYRIVQEAANNILKHSGASEAGVSVRRAGDELRLLVWDNGKGFEQNSPSSKHSGFGLTGMTERARILGGKIEVNSVKDEGTSVTFLVKI